MDRVYTTPIEMGVEFGQCPPRTPTSNQNNHLRTPTSNQIKVSPGCTSSSKRSRVFDNLKFRSRNKSSDTDENTSPKTLGRRKSVRNLFTSVRSRTHQDNVECKPTSLPQRPKTVSPSKSRDSTGARTLQLKRRKSISQMFTTLSRKPSSKNDTAPKYRETGTDTIMGPDNNSNQAKPHEEKKISSEDNNHYVSTNAEFLEALRHLEAFENRQCNNQGGPSVNLTLAALGTCEDAKGIAERLERLLYMFREAAKRPFERNSLAALSDTGKQAEPHPTENQDSSNRPGMSDSQTVAALEGDPSEMTGSEQIRVRTPDSYLCHLIQSHNSYASLPETPITTLSDPKPYQSPSQPSLTLRPTKRVLPNDIYVEENNSEKSSTHQLSSQEAKVSWELLPHTGQVEISSFSNQQLIPPVPELDSSFEAEDIEPELHHKTEQRNKRNENLDMQPIVSWTSDSEYIATSITMVVARMTENYHLFTRSRERSLLKSENNSKEAKGHDDRVQKEEWKKLDGIDYGGKIVDEPYRKCRVNQSFGELPRRNCSMDQMLDNSMERRTRKEPSPSLNSMTQVTEIWPIPSIDQIQEQKHFVEPQSHVGGVMIPEFTAGSSTTKLQAEISRLSTELEDATNYQPNFYINRGPSRILSQSSPTTSNCKRPQSSQKTRLVSLTPVRVELPAVQNRVAKTQVYHSRSKAIAALYEQNQGEFDNFFTYDPRSRTIYAHLRDTFVPSREEIRLRGLEILWLPTFNESVSYANSDLSMPMTSPTPSSLDVALIQNRGASEYLYVSPIDKPGVGYQGSSYDSEIDFLGSGHNVTPVSSLHIDPASPDGDNEKVVFDDDFFLEVDSQMARSFLGSQYSDLTCSSLHESLALDEIIRPGSTTELLCNLNEENQVSPIRTWAELGREYLAKNPLRRSTRSRTSDGTKEWTGGSDFYEEYSKVECGFSRAASRLSKRSTGSPAYTDDLDSTETYQELHEAREIAMEIAHQELGEGSIENPCSLIAERVNLGHMNMSSTSTVPNESNSKSMTAESGTNLPSHVSSDSEVGCGLSTSYKKSSLDIPIGLEPRPLRARCESIDSFWSDACESKDESRSVSNASNLSGFKFTAYGEQLSQLDSQTEAINNTIFTSSGEEDLASHKSSSMKGGETLLAVGTLEPCVIHEDETNEPESLTGDEPDNIVVGKAFRRTQLAQQRTKKIGALIDIFQARGLMPQSLRPRLYRSPPPLTYTQESDSTEPVPRITFPSNMMRSTSASLPPGSRYLPSRTPPISPFLRPDSGLSNADTEVSSLFGELLERMGKHDEYGEETRRDCDFYG